MDSGSFQIHPGGDIAIITDRGTKLLCVGSHEHAVVKNVLTTDNSSSSFSSCSTFPNNHNLIKRKHESINNSKGPLETDCKFNEIGFVFKMERRIKKICKAIDDLEKENFQGNEKNYMDTMETIKSNWEHFTKMNNDLVQLEHVWPDEKEIMRSVGIITNQKLPNHFLNSLEQYIKNMDLDSFKRSYFDSKFHHIVFRNRMRDIVENMKKEMNKTERFQNDETNTKSPKNSIVYHFGTYSRLQRIYKEQHKVKQEITFCENRIDSWKKDMLAKMKRQIPIKKNI